MLRRALTGLAPARLALRAASPAARRLCTAGTFSHRAAPSARWLCTTPQLHELLELRADAPDEEVRLAYRAALRLAPAWASPYRNLALADLEGDVVDGDQGGAAPGNLDAQVLDLKQRGPVGGSGHRGQRSLGFKASRNQSPSVASSPIHPASTSHSSPCEYA